MSRFLAASLFVAAAAAAPVPTTCGRFDVGAGATETCAVTLTEGTTYNLYTVSVVALIPSLLSARPSRAHACAARPATRSRARAFCSCWTSSIMKWYVRHAGRAPPVRAAGLLHFFFTLLHSSFTALTAPPTELQRQLPVLRRQHHLQPHRVPSSVLHVSVAHL